MKSLAALLRSLGLLLIGSGAAFLLFVAASPLGLIDAYPDPPDDAIQGALGLEQEVKDVADLYREPDEPMQAYLERLTKAVAGGMVHYWTEGDSWSAADTRYTGIGVFDNYLLWTLSFSPRYRDSFQSYEFMTPEKALDRGYGFCSQVSKIVYSILTDQGIEAAIFNVPEHTVVEAEGNILDADYGVFIPHSLAEVRQNPSVIDRYYGQFESMLPLLHKVYGEPWQQLGTPQGFSEVRAYEVKFDRLKWFPPLILLGAGALFCVISAVLRSHRG